MEATYQFMAFDELLSALHVSADVAMGGMENTIQRSGFGFPCYTHVKIIGKSGEFEPYFYIDRKNDNLHTKIKQTLRDMRGDGFVESIIEKYK